MKIDVSFILYVFHCLLFLVAGSESDQIVLTRKNGQNLGIQIMTRK